MYWKDKNKEKEAGNGPFFKNLVCLHLTVEDNYLTNLYFQSLFKALGNKNSTWSLSASDKSIDVVKLHSMMAPYSWESNLSRHIDSEVPLSGSSSDKEESLACQITSPFNKYLGCFYIKLKRLLYKTMYLFVEWEVIWEASDSPLSKELHAFTNLLKMSLHVRFCHSHRCSALRFPNRSSLVGFNKDSFT